MSLLEQVASPVSGIVQVRTIQMIRAGRPINLWTLPGENQPVIGVVYKSSDLSKVPKFVGFRHHLR